MKTRTLTQVRKEHNVNALHDAFNAAGLQPLRAESTPVESRFVFDDSIPDQSITDVITAYVFQQSAQQVDIRQAWQNYRAAIQNATTIPQIKQALTQDLGVLLKELLRSQTNDLQ